MIIIRQKESVRVLPMLVTLIHGMWLALLCVTSNEEAHADMIVHPSDDEGRNFHTHEHLPLLTFLAEVNEIATFLNQPKTKRQ